MRDVFTYYFDGQPIPYKVAKRLIENVCGRVPHSITPWVHLCLICDSNRPEALTLKSHLQYSSRRSIFDIDSKIDSSNILDSPF